MTKEIKPAKPVSTDPRLRELEKPKREEIAEIKQTDPAQGKEESLGASVIFSALDHDVTIGRNFREHGEKAQRKEKIKNEIRWQDYQNDLDQMMRYYPHLSLTEARRRVATKNGVHLSTIVRHTKRPKNVP